MSLGSRAGHVELAWRLGMGATNMGTTHVAVTVRNPADPDRTWEALFLVDTGAIDCFVPEKHLREIGLAPKAKRTYELANGSEIRMDITTGEIEFMGEIVGSTTIFAPDDAEPILGVTALESVGIEVDPRTQRLKRLPAVRLKSSAPAGFRTRKHGSRHFARKSISNSDVGATPTWCRGCAPVA